MADHTATSWGAGLPSTKQDYNNNNNNNGFFPKEGTGSQNSTGSP